MCGKLLVRGERGICRECREHLPVVTEPVCRHCGKPIADSGKAVCLDCAKKSSEIREGKALWTYTEQMKSAIADFKYSGHMNSGEFFAEELLRCGHDWICSRKVECIVPVPLHARKKRFRGFNQAEYLAGYLAENLQLPVCRALVRTRDTRPQKGLDDKQRAKNLRGVFELTKGGLKVLRDVQRILLVDDIYTTGATLEECARALRTYSDFSVYSICLCIGKDY